MGDHVCSCHIKILLQFGDVNPDEYTFVYYGRPLHARVSKGGFEDSIIVENTLISMYFMSEDPCATAFLRET